MSDSLPTPRRWMRLAVIFGALGLFCYFVSVPVGFLPNEINRYLFMAYGPFLAVAAYAFGQVLAAREDSPSLRIAIMMLVVSGAMVSMMTVVQTVNFTVMADRIEHAGDEATRVLLRRIMWGVNNVQGALDIAFDIWVAMGGLFLAAACLRHPWFGRVYGWTGLIAVGAPLFLNLFTFPYVPAESGLFDLGPLIGVWFAALLIQVVRMARKEPSEFWDRVS